MTLFNLFLQRTLPSAILRRFEKRIFVDLPNSEEREEIIRQLLPESGCPNLSFSVDYNKIAQVTVNV